MKPITFEVSIYFDAINLISSTISQEDIENEVISMYGETDYYDDKILEEMRDEYRIAENICNKIFEVDIQKYFTVKADKISFIGEDFSSRTQDSAFLEYAVEVDFDVETFINELEE